MRKIWKIVIPIAVVIFLFQRSSNAFSERQLSVSINGQIVCYRENTFQVNAPESGHLTITVNTDDTVYQIIEADVETGKNSIKWDGLGFNEEKLYPMNYHIDADLNGNSGIKYQFRFDSQIINSAQAMTLALPSSEKLYLDNREEWFLECKVIRSGMLLIEMIPEGASEPAYTFRKNVEPLRIIHLTFDDIAGKTQISPGRYTMRVFEMSNTAYMKEFIITAESIMPDMPPVSVTGQIMPEEENDEEIWNMMMEPAVVINIGSMNHQNVYESPDEKSASLGTLHGQTQALCVIRIWNDWALVEAWNHEEAEKVTGWIPLGKLKVVYPNRDYGLLVSKKDQTVAVFYRGKRLDTIRVCTGKMEKNRLYQETAAGSFLTGEHRVDYSTNGNKYDFVIQYDGGNLIHQIPYRFGEGKKDFTEGKALLGTKASHACIRIQSDPGKQSGINAYWIWTHIPYHTRVIILDDADERHAEKEKIYGINNQKMKDESGETPSGEIKGNANTGREPEKSLKNAGNDTVLMTFGGDAVLGGREWYYYRDDSLPAYVEKYGMSYPFSGLQEYFASDDLTSINLECVLKADSSGEDESKKWRFRGLPEYINILTEGSVEFVNIANNHTIDYGDAGYQSTIRAIESGSVAWCGRNRPTAVEVKGHLIGFGGCRETTYKTDPDTIARDIQQLKDMGCEYIVYQCHWGTEYSMQFNAMQQTMAHACVNAGADLVVGHHPHVVQGIDYIGDVPVVYSLGNLCFGGTIELDERGFDAILARVLIKFDGVNPKTEIRIIPIRTSSSASDGMNDFRPVPAEETDALRILKYVQNDSGREVPK